MFRTLTCKLQFITMPTWASYILKVFGLEGLSLVHLNLFSGFQNTPSYNKLCLFCLENLVQAGTLSTVCQSLVVMQHLYLLSCLIGNSPSSFLGSTNDHTPKLPFLHLWLSLFHSLKSPNFMVWSISKNYQRDSLSSRSPLSVFKVSIFVHIQSIFVITPCKVYKAALIRFEQILPSNN